MTSQLERWQGKFGREYTDRNVVDWRTRVDTFRRIIPVDTRSVFEVGVNRAHNLEALREVLGERADLRGCEPSTYAWRRTGEHLLNVCSCSVYDLPDLHRLRLDLVFTSGVLIHVPPERLDEALTNIYVLSRRHILAIEYHADQDTPVDYRGYDDMLWKRDYGQHYLRLFPELELVDMGDLTEADGFAGARYWLLAK